MRRTIFFGILGISLSLILGAAPLFGAMETSSPKVAMLADIGLMDDKSYNYGIWEGLLRAKKDFGIEPKRIFLDKEAEEERLKAVERLYQEGYALIIAPGASFSRTIYEGQVKYPDMSFVLMDSSPHKGNYKFLVGKNTVSVYFAEHEAAFLAGVATALQMQRCSVGFIGGMEIPAVQKYNWGFQQGIAYANKYYKTEITMEPGNFVYQGTFSDILGGRQLASHMYDLGVDVIFAAAGGVGIGVIEEARARALGGQKVWVVGVDMDQYAAGLYKEKTRSVILTSALKNVTHAVYSLVETITKDTFPSGETLLFNVANGGVGIPSRNPNLSKDVQQKLEALRSKIKSGIIKIPLARGNLFH